MKIRSVQLEFDFGDDYSKERTYYDAITGLMKYTHKIFK